MDIVIYECSFADHTCTKHFVVLHGHTNNKPHINSKIASSAPNAAVSKM